MIKKKLKESLPSENKIPYTDFAKLDFRIGKILKIEEHPNADLLYILSVDIGEDKTRTVVAGLRKNYTKEQLQGKKAAFIINLEPAIIRNIKSEGMILAAASDDESQIIILEPEKDIEQGAKIK